MSRTKCMRSARLPRVSIRESTNCEFSRLTDLNTIDRNSK